MAPVSDANWGTDRGHSLAHTSTREMLQYISKWKSQPNATWRNKPKAMATAAPEKGNNKCWEKEPVEI